MSVTQFGAAVIAVVVLACSANRAEHAAAITLASDDCCRPTSTNSAAAPRPS
ncbi:hypothetical protein [Mycolicibacterium vulneris]|uniref:hypothetical protein n=1 Tax=Mycolicibacterium vulneris TaxID=547163 RepID=UPI0013FD4BA6|nr:hypothetical protein [Mycolicibacterium vulneris]